jgi:hypothetical protein
MSYERPTYEELARDTLLQMMRDISEDCWFAGWLHNLEFILWDAVKTGKVSWGEGLVKERDLIRMKYLHELACGWWILVKGEEIERFVSTEEWLAVIAKRVAP